MGNQFYRRKWIYGLLLIPVISAILALLYHDFAYKAGVAGSGILILTVSYFSQLKRRYGDVWLINGAFLFSIGGDWFLSNKHGDSGMFIAGIMLFFFAHVGYLLYALKNGRISKIFTIGLLIGYLAFFFLKLFPSIDNRILMMAALVYLLISCFSLGAAVGIQAKPMIKWPYVFGIILILLSDTIIALKEFAAYNTLDYMILPTYYLAQISVTLAMLKKTNLFYR